MHLFSSLCTDVLVNDETMFVGNFLMVLIDKIEEYSDDELDVNTFLKVLCRHCLIVEQRTL